MPFVKVSSGVQVHYSVPSCRSHTDIIDHTKPTVVLLHPRLIDGYFFAPNYRDARLAGGYNLVTFDHHWHGKTQPLLDKKPYDFKLVAQDMLRAMTALKITKAHVLGVSLGSQIAVVMQTIDPGRILSLILCSVLPEKETDENIEQYTFLRDACYEKADDGTDCLASDVVHGLHWIYFGDDPNAMVMIDEWVASGNFKPSNRALINKNFSAVLDRKPIDPKLWASIKCPVMVIQGAEDVACSQDVARVIYDMMVRAPKVIHFVPHGPHFVSFTHPLVVNTLVADFYDRITGLDSKAAALRPMTEPARTAPPSASVFEESDSSLPPPRERPSSSVITRLFRSKR